MNNSGGISDRIKNWLKNPHNLVLIGIIMLSFFIRLFYFLKFGNQAIWWDEAEYMSLSKRWALGVPYEANPQRPPLFQLLGAIVFMVGLGESFIRFAFVLLPSTFLVFAVYLLGKEMYDRKIGLIAAFLTAVSWTLLFWGARIQPDFFSMCFQVMAIWFMWKYWKTQNSDYPITKFAVMAAFFAALSFYFKITGLLVPMIFCLFILIKDRLDGFRNKDYWIFAIIYLLTLVPYFIWAKLEHGKYLAFRTGYSNPVAYDWPFEWGVFKFFYFLNIGVLFVLFLLGVILGLKFLLYIDFLIKNKKKVFNPNIFGILSIIYIAAFYIFYQRAIEDRWIFLWLPFMFFFIGNALKFIYKFIKPHGKNIALFVILGLLAFGAYSQIQKNNSLAEERLYTYKVIEMAGLWIKDNSEVGDIVLSRSKTQNTYYSERFTKSYNDFATPGELDAYIEENKPRYFVISIYEIDPDWLSNWFDENIDRLELVLDYYPQNKEVIEEYGADKIALSVYEIKY